MGEVVSIKFRGQDEVTSVTSKIKGELGGLDKAAGGFSKAFAGGMAGLGAGLGIAGVTMVAQQIGDLANEAGKVQILRGSFQDLAAGVGASSDVMLSAMRKASGGMISDQNLMLAANRAMSLGVAGSADEMATLLDVARVKGQAMGLSVTQSFNDLVTGLGRGSAEILDNLGITVDTEKVMGDYAASLGITAAELDKTQKMQALLNEVMRQAGTMDTASVENAATAWERASAAIDNAKVALGEAFGPLVAQLAGGVAVVATGIADAFNPDAVDTSMRAWQMYSAQLDEAKAKLAEFEQLKKTALPENADAMMKQQASLQYGVDFTDTAGQTAAMQAQIDALARLSAAELARYTTLRGLMTSTGNYSTILYVNTAAQAAAANATAILDAASSRTTGAVDGLKNRIMAGVGVAYSAAQAMLFLAQATGIAAEAANRLKVYSALFGAEEGAVRTAEWVNSQVTGVNTVIQSYEDLGKTGAAAANTIEQEFESLKGKVSSVISGLLNPEGVSINGGGAGAPRQDAANENARRLAAIANEGFANQPWLEEFKKEAGGVFADLKLTEAAGGDVRAAAAQLYADFQAGLDLRTLDREAVKQRVRDMLLGDAQMSQLATEIATELSQEMGVSLPEAMSAAQGALGVKKSDGAALQDGFTAGVDGDAVAAGSLAKIAAAFLENRTKVKEAGEVVGGWWGEGFMGTVGDNVPVGLLDLLVAKLLPAILAAIAGNGSTTNPSDAGGGTGGGA